MSALHSPRAPWFMLAVFCAVALLLFLAAAGPDLGLILDTGPDPEPAPVKREVRMPIVIETPKSPTPKVIPDTRPGHETPAPAPGGHAAGHSSDKPATPAPPALPARPGPDPLQQRQARSCPIASNGAATDSKHISRPIDPSPAQRSSSDPRRRSGWSICPDAGETRPHASTPSTRAASRAWSSASTPTSCASSFTTERGICPDRPRRRG